MERPRHSRRDSHLQCSRWLLRPPRQPAPVTPEWMLLLRILMLKTVPFAWCAVPSAAAGPEVPFVWPSCGHRVLGCVAHLRVNSRHMSCPFCRTGWTSVAVFRALGLLASGGPVIQHSFCPSRSPSLPPPPPPSSVTAFCCQHVALVDSSRADSDQAWVDLPSRHMAWMPVFNQGTGRWDPEWVCLRCNENLTGHHPLLQNVPVVPVCAVHGARVLAVDVAYGERACQPVPLPLTGDVDMAPLADHRQGQPCRTSVPTPAAAASASAEPPRAASAS